VASYLSKIDGVVGARRELARVDRVLGGSLTGEHVEDTYQRAPVYIGDGIGTVVGAAVGGYFGHKYGHTVLGVIGGGSLGRNLPVALMQPSLRKDALVNMGQTFTGVLAARMVPAHPVAAFVTGWFGAGAVIYFAGWRG
jgi:hypothetical protein